MWTRNFTDIDQFLVHLTGDGILKIEIRTTERTHERKLLQNHLNPDDPNGIDPNYIQDVNLRIRAKFFFPRVWFALITSNTHLSLTAFCTLLEKFADTLLQQNFATNLRNFFLKFKLI